jgi:carbamoyltransferase
MAFELFACAMCCNFNADNVSLLWEDHDGEQEKPMTAILGISNGTSGSAACLTVDGVFLAAAREEIFSRRKADTAFPLQAIGHCLRSARIEAKDLDYVSVADKPFLRLDRELNAYIESWPLGFRSFLKSNEVLLSEKLLISSKIRKVIGVEKPIIYCHPHEALAAFAHWHSPEKKSAIMVIDDGRLPSAVTVFSSEGRRVRAELSLNSPHSPWCFLQAFALYLGSLPEMDEPQTGHRFVNDLENFLNLNPNGGISLSTDFFDLSGDQARLRINRVEKALRIRALEPSLNRELARAVLHHYDRAVGHLANFVFHRLKCQNLLVGGIGVAGLGSSPSLGGLGAGRVSLLRGKVSAQACAGAALFAQSNLLNREASNFDLHPGSATGDKEFQEYLNRSGIRHEVCTEAELAEKVGASLSRSETVAWMQGKVDFFRAHDQLLMGVAGSPKWLELKNRCGFLPSTVCPENLSRISSAISSYQKIGFNKAIAFADMESTIEPPPAKPQEAYRFFRFYGIDRLVLGNCLVSREENV